MSRSSHKVFGVALTAVLLFGASANADPVKIRDSWLAPVSNLASILFAKDGVAKHNGTSYVMEPVHFQGSPQMMTALATGELEIGLLAYSSFSLGVQNAGMADFRIISDEIRDGVGDYYSHEFMVRADSPIRTVEELKGKVLATNAVGSAVDIAMRAELTKHGLADKNATTIVEAAFPNMKAMLIQGKVDLLPGVLPFSQDLELRKAARTLFTEKDGMGPTNWASLWRAPASSKSIGSRWSISWRIISAPCAGTRTPPITRKRSRSRSNSASSPRRCSTAGFSRRRTITAIPTGCRISMRCSRTSMSSRSLAS